MADERHAQLRGRILAIASAIIEREGIGALQARRLANEAGCSVGTLYNAYGNLDRLILAVNSITLDRLLQLLVEAHRGANSDGEQHALASHAELEASLSALAFAYLSFADQERNAWRALFEHKLTTETEVPEEFRAKQNELFAVVERALSTTLTDPALRTRAGRALFGAVHGIVTLALDEKLDAFDVEETRQQVRLLIAATARGLAERDQSASVN